METFERGQFVQLAPGDADPKDWGFLIAVTDNGQTATFAHYLTGELKTVSTADLYPAEAKDFKAAIRAFMRLVFR